MVINYCNEVIKNAPLVREIDDTFTDYQLQSFLSEAYFLRSPGLFLPGQDLQGCALHYRTHRNG